MQKIKSNTTFDAFTGNTGLQQVDAVVVGGGLVGLSSALELQKNGIQTILLEARHVAGGSSANSLGVITFGHETFFSTLSSVWKNEDINSYVQLSNIGLRNIKNNIQQYDIDCDFADADFLTFATSKSEMNSLEKELKLVNNTGLVATIFSPNEMNIPIKDYVGSLCLKNQAIIDIVKYMQGLASAFVKEGGQIFENSRVTDIDEKSSPHVLTLENGSIIRAKYVVLATHLPILDSSTHFHFVEALASYMVHLPLEKPVENPNLIFSSIDHTDFNSKTVRWSSDGKSVWIMGFPHPLGKMDSFKDINPFDELINFGRINLGVARDAEPLGKFFDFDYATKDYLPFIGTMYKSSNTMFTATGFNLWGYALAAAAPRYFLDIIKGTVDLDKSPFRIVDANRWNTSQVYAFFERGGGILKHLIADSMKGLVNRTGKGIDDILPGETEICSYEGKSCMCQKSEDGTSAKIVPLTCTHQGCTTSFNKFTNTLDCGCHGSRYDLDGNIISAPSVTKLDVKTIPVQPSDTTRQTSHTTMTEKTGKWERDQMQHQTGQQFGSPTSSSQTKQSGGKIFGSDTKTFSDPGHTTTTTTTTTHE